MRDYVLVYVNGQRHEVRGAAAFGSLSTFLREQLRLVGTKIVCSEGDCGSCTVLLGRAAGEGIKYEPVCSCIQYLFQLDCVHVVTVEGLRYEGRLNPVQEAMVKHHGAQCGFCTPGFVVSMCGLMDKCGKPTEQELRRGLVGNLCRCTGYQAIVEAGMDVEAGAMRPLKELYDTAGIAGEFAKCEGEGVMMEDGGRKFCKPVTVGEAVAFKGAHPGCVVVAGGTDLGVQWNKGHKTVGAVLGVGGLKEMQGVEVKDGVMSVGAGVTLTELEEATNKVLPEYGRMMGWFGSPPIRNAGTVGGNIGNGSPIADTTPAWFVLEAEIELAGKGGRRRVGMNGFYTGYKKNVMGADEVIVRVHVPLPKAGELFKVYKVSRRKDLDISTFTAAIWVRPAGGVVGEVRIAYGGVGATVLRLPKTEGFLRGRALEVGVFREAGEVARGEVVPLTDVRGSAEYRWQLAENILGKFAGEVLDVRLGVMSRETT